MIQRIYNERYIILKFATVGAIGFIFNYLVLQICTSELSLNKVVSEIIAAILALQVTFILNDKWTYSLHNRNSKLKFKLYQRYIAYLTTNSFGSFMTVVLFAAFSHFLDKLLALACAALAAMIWNYTMNLIFIWRRSFSAKESIIGDVK